MIEHFDQCQPGFDFSKQQQHQQQMLAKNEFNQENIFPTHGSEQFRVFIVMIVFEPLIDLFTLCLLHNWIVCENEGEKKECAIPGTRRV